MEEEKEEVKEDEKEDSNDINPERCGATSIRS